MLFLCTRFLNKPGYIKHLPSQLLQYMDIIISPQGLITNDPVNAVIYVPSFYLYYRPALFVK